MHTSPQNPLGEMIYWDAHKSKAAVNQCIGLGLQNPFTWKW
jgi:hypothetical protein